MYAREKSGLLRIFYKKSRWRFAISFFIEPFWEIKDYIFAFAACLKEN
jgi:hypothetical protein